MNCAFQKLMARESPTVLYNMWLAQNEAG